MNSNLKKDQQEYDTKATIVTKKNSDGDVLVAFAGNSKIGDEWILDKTCTFHMRPNRDWYVNYEAMQVVLCW